MAKNKDDVTKETVVADKYSKSAILSSKKYANRRDVLGVLLEDGKEYSTAEVDDLLDNYMKGKVK